LLFEDRLSIIARERLRALYETQDGFEISQRDLSLRGPGEFLGARQSGVALLRFADYQADAMWVERARDTAVMLRRDQPETAAAHIHRWMLNRQDYLLS
jgi:ATP-dependent DNA helicase RecG